MALGAPGLGGSGLALHGRGGGLIASRYGDYKNLAAAANGGSIDSTSGDLLPTYPSSFLIDGQWGLNSTWVSARQTGAPDPIAWVIVKLAGASAKTPALIDRIELDPWVNAIGGVYAVRHVTIEYSTDKVTWTTLVSRYLCNEDYVSYTPTRFYLDGGASNRFVVRDPANLALWQSLDHVRAVYVRFTYHDNGDPSNLYVGTTEIRVFGRSAGSPTALPGTVAPTTGQPLGPHLWGTATLLGNGKVLIAGGQDDSATALSVCELYDPATKLFAATGAMLSPRTEHAAVLLADGKVLVTGGGDGSTVLATAELYDPTAGTWSATTGNMLVGRANHHMVRFTSGTLNGKVLVATGNAPDGSGCKLCDLYDPTTKTFSATGGLAIPDNSYGGGTGRDRAVLILCNNGVVLAAGGAQEMGIFNAERYIPATGTWAMVAGSQMYERRAFASAVALADGRIFITQGYGGDGQIHVNFTCDTYDPTNNIFASTQGMDALYSRMRHETVLLSNGKVLVLGGGRTASLSAFNGYESESLTPVNEIYDPAADSWSQVAPLATLREAPLVAGPLSDGTVLVCCGRLDYPHGNTCLSSAELFTPP